METINKPNMKRYYHIVSSPEEANKIRDTLDKMSIINSTVFDIAGLSFDCYITTYDPRSTELGFKEGEEVFDPLQRDFEEEAYHYMSEGG